MTEIIYWTHGVQISRDTLYKFRKEYFNDFISKLREELREQLEQSHIQFSEVLSFDEQYVKVMGEWIYKVTAMDSVTGHVYDIAIATKEEYDKEYVINFLKPLVEKFSIEVLVTDGAKMYPEIMEELGVKHKLCNFHKMQNLIKRIRGKLISLNKKIDNNKQKIKENEEQIKEIEQQRTGKLGRPTEEEQKIVDEKKDLNSENRKIRAETREYKHELASYKKIIHDVSLLLRSKSKETGIKRYNKILANIDEVPEEARGFIRNMEKDLDKLLLHTEYDNVPTTNNKLELYHLTTLNGRTKRQYKTKEGVLEETLLKTIRWEQRNVLGKITH